MKVTATTLPRKSASVTCAPSCEVSANSGAGAIFGSGGSSEACCGASRESASRRHASRHERRKRQDERRPHAQPFSSRLSSLKKRQSVPCAMILLGFDLIMPASRSRKRVETDGILGVVVAPLACSGISFSVWSA